MMTAPRVLDWMSALGDMTRVRVLHACQQHELSVADICSVLRIPQSTASRHLKVLSEDRWLVSRRDGTSNLYALDREHLPPPARQLWKLIREQFNQDPVLRNDDARLEQVLLQRRTQSQAFFASAAGKWDRLRGELFGQRVDLKMALGLLPSNAVVGDLGCGTGATAEFLCDFATRIIAIDDSAEMMRAARERLRNRSNVELHKSSLESLPLDDGVLDVAFLNLVLHHVSDPAAVIREVGRVLAPSGRLIVVDMQQHDREEYRQQMGHVWLGFSEKQLTTLLQNAGLAPERHVALAPDPEGRGPALFVATATRPVTIIQQH
jgi:ubiquinone/menaquinone biosynthesis C-methylase UbiE/DNA-binding transcriptional ArsR family regulator